MSASYEDDFRDVDSDLSTSGSPLLAALEYEQNHPHAYRRANAGLRLQVAIHESAHAVMAAQYVPHGRIDIPFKHPERGSAQSPSMLREQEAETFFAGVVVDKFLLDHHIYALHDLCKGLHELFLEYGPACDKGEPLMERTRAYVRLMWPNIEALATEAMRKEKLAYADFQRAARKCGLERRGVGPRRQGDVDAYLRQFSQSPEELRARLGADILKRWGADMLKHWLPTAGKIKHPCPRDDEPQKFLDTTELQALLVARNGWVSASTDVSPHDLTK